ncbi:ABC transporter ATP-binding protein [Cohnella candidum]|uniref:ATP-binding cassette domain-containing protein n=1 Tax=Cohnella candidum TaxID=2674991 RepID=A0A3G3JTH4_9BACL|nr:ATP-binding cassette domain-containing protein [Cohnella candidum]AYQ71530.1 ATP-binding cassette domain-containing protein [Cohnella candidum]
MSIIEVNDLVREFKVNGKAEGALGLLKSLFSQEGTVKRVVDRLSFSIGEGEFVGYLGPNGAGKSTTIKMMSGVLVPSSGNIRILGLEPYKQRKEHASNIGVVFGQRTQLWWDLPLHESFRLLGAIYDIPPARYRQNIEMFTEILEMRDFLQTPVRQLSLGQRMRGDIAAALLHDPKLLFLDEPTIGLDLVAKEKIQNFLKTINEEKKITIMLTTHNMDDIEKLCSRVIFIDQGRSLYDGSMQEMTRRFGGHRYVVVETAGWEAAGWKGPRIEKEEGGRLWFRITHDDQVAGLIRELSEHLTIQNLTVSEPRIEEIIRQLYTLKEQGEEKELALA